MKIYKENVKELAIWTGFPAFESFLHVGRPNVGDRDILLKRINEMLDRRWFTNNGVFVQEFERRLSEYLRVRNCIVVCNATVGLEILTRALDWQGDVIVPSFTFVASAHALQWSGVRPLFCDVDPYTHNLDVSCVERLITPRVTGILGVHVWGRPCAIEELTAIAMQYNLKLAYDAAHAFGCSFKGNMIGCFGEAEVFSFHATKFFNSFEGGAIVTNNDELASKIRNMINFGFLGYDNVGYLGTNGKMTEVAAAMGLTSLEALEKFVDVNVRNYETYSKELSEIPGIHLISYDQHEKNNYQYIIVEVDSEKSFLTRDQLYDVLHAEHVLSRRYFYPGCHKMEPYCTLYPEDDERLQNTNRLSTRTLSLPNGTAITEEDIRAICQILRLAISSGEKVSHQLNSYTNK